MSVSLTINGTVYPFPQTNDENWGDQVTSWATAISQATLQKNGGVFTLSADVDFGASYGLKALYLKSRATNPGTTGIIRLGNAEALVWRNAANSADLQLTASASNRLTYDGVVVPTISSTDTLTNKTLTSPVINTPTGITKSDVGLGNVDNTSDANKPISTATATALATKEPTITSGTTSQYWRGDKSFQTLDKTAVGLANVDNTSDANKPISTATATALSGKQATITQLPIANGGTGQATQTAAFDALSPTTTKGDLTVRGTSNNVRLAAGADTYVLTADSSTANGIKWAAPAASGSGTGVKNYISPSNTAASNWTASGAGVTVTTELTASNLPDNLTQTSGIKVLRVSGTTAYAYNRFTLDQADYNKKLAIQWDQAFAGAAGDFTIAVYSNTASNYAGTSTPLTIQTTSVAAGTLSFVTTFDSPGSTAPYLELRFIATAGVSPLYLNNVTVTPGQVAQGAALGDWISFTPTWANMGTTSSEVWSYRRVGSSMQIMGTSILSGAGAAAAVTMTIPGGFTANTTLAPTGVFKTDLGSAQWLDAGNADINVFSYILSTTAWGFSKSTTAVLQGNDLASTDNLRANIFIPIAEWAGNGTVNLGPGAQVEYAYNTSGITAAGAVDTTAFANGPSGALIGSIASTTAGSSVTSMRVRFQYPVQVSDTIVLECDNGSSGLRWMPLGEGSSGNVCWLSFLSASAYGAGVAQISSTDFDVYFGNQGRYPSNAAYAGSGSAWSGVGSSYRWRLRKSSSSAPVGFGLAGTDGSSGLYKPGNAPGSVTGSAIGAGYIGERAVSTFTGTNFVTGSYQTGTSITLSAGIWDITCVIYVPSTASLIGVNYGVATATNSNTGHTLGDTALSLSTVSGQDTGGCLAAVRKEISSPTTYYLTARPFGATASGCNGRISAVRVG